MTPISISEEWQTLEKTDCTVCRISAYRVHNETTQRFFSSEPRTNYALTFCRQGEWHYESESSAVSFDCYPGELSFLPRGSVYHHHNAVLPSGMSVVYFDLRHPDGTPYRMQNTEIQKLVPAKPGTFAPLFDEIQNAFFSAIPSVFRLKQAVFALLCAVGAEFSRRHITEREYAMLIPALQVLSEPMTDAVTVTHLADACHMSEYAFRELFKKYAGVPPKAYLMERRLQQVEALLAVRDISATDAARACGFEDPSYFFHFYKRLRGHSPGNSNG